MWGAMQIKTASLTLRAYEDSHEAPLKLFFLLSNSFQFTFPLLFLTGPTEMTLTRTPGTGPWMPLPAPIDWDSTAANPQCTGFPLLKGLK